MYADIQSVVQHVCTLASGLTIRLVVEEKAVIDSLTFDSCELYRMLRDAQHDIVLEGDCIQYYTQQGCYSLYICN